MTRYKDIALAAAGVLLALLLVVPGTAALAQDLVVHELELEIQEKDATYIYAGPQLIRYQLTADTLVIDTDGTLSSINAQVTPFMAVVKYTLPADGAEGAAPVAVEIRVLETVPQ
jgi:hypothetical protein